MNIDILCNDGSPIGVSSKTIWGDTWRIGIGGAELAMLTMAEEWTKAGHTVVLYNNPWEYDASPFEQRTINSFEREADRDILINFRSPNKRTIGANGLKVWWSTDQYSVGDYRQFAEYVDKVVCISPFHASYFYSVYGITNSIVIDLPVRVDDFKDKQEVKIPNRFIFTSVPERGLANLHRMWPKIKALIPDATLRITSDYRLWGASALNENHRVMWMNYSDFEFLGAVPREQYLQELVKADILLYPCVYEELFCIAVAEASYAGAYPITSGVGALGTTNMGSIIDTDSNDRRSDVLFINEVVELLENRERLEEMRSKLFKEAEERFSPLTILNQWNELVFK